jgi:hypothetical protein
MGYRLTGSGAKWSARSKPALQQEGGSVSCTLVWEDSGARLGRQGVGMSFQSRYRLQAAARVFDANECQFVVTIQGAM